MKTGKGMNLQRGREPSVRCGSQLSRRRGAVKNKGEKEDRNARSRDKETKEATMGAETSNRFYICGGESRR